MKKYLKRILAVIIILSSMGSCKEFIESPVTGKKIFLNAPSESLETNKYNIQFWWDLVDDATAYSLQVVNPDFNAAASLILDTLIKGNKYMHTLDPGKYEWRVRAENASSQGLYTTRSFTIYESSLENQQVQVQAPSNGVISNTATLTFKWLPLYGAKKYILQVDTNNFTSENNLVLNQNTINSEYTLNLQKDKLYQWRVRAENNLELSKWSALQNFTYDTFPPAKVTLVSPSNNQMVGRPVTLRWSSVSGASRYELLVLKSDSTTAYDSTFPLTLSNTAYSLNAGDFNETLYWKVRAKDQAGNVGAYSNIQSFIIQ